jgi:hypothetical protein
MLFDVSSGTVYVVCHACELPFTVPLPAVQVTDLRGTSSTISYQFHATCTHCGAVEAWPSDHSPLVQTLQTQLGLT